MNINQKQIHIKNNKNSVVNFYGTFSYIFFCWMMSKNVFVMAKYDAFYALQWTLIQFIFFFLMILLANKFVSLPRFDWQKWNVFMIAARKFSSLRHKTLFFRKFIKKCFAQWQVWITIFPLPLSCSL